MAPDPLQRQPAAPRRWLSIVGIGEDGVAGLAPAARSLIAAAEVVFGGNRHLLLAAPLIRGTPHPWPSPLDAALPQILGYRNRSVCVLASGDPFLYGIGALLAGHIPPEETVVVPGPSAFSLAAARLGWALAETALVSLHARPLDLVRPHLQPGARVLALTSGSGCPAALARLLVASGFGGSRLTVLEALGGPRERVRATTARAFDLDAVDPLNVVAIDVAAGAGARVLPLAAGLADDLFEHDGQITKREIRAATLAALAPRSGELLWDVGAGAGSVAIAWMLADRSLGAIAVERQPERAARVARNAAACGVPGLKVVTGAAPGALAGLPRPEAIFLGGGARDEGVLGAARSALRPGGRLVVNAVTLQTEALLIAEHAAQGGELTRFTIARARAMAGRISGTPAAAPAGAIAWRTALPVTQWLWVKP
jgi:precorrin-6Y C5,15-methyltransferase (decarboxylating)